MGNKLVEREIKIGIEFSVANIQVPGRFASATGSGRVNRFAIADHVPRSRDGSELVIVNITTR